MKKSKVDALIIGSGVGGMSSAARLVSKGMNVRVVERLSIIGGRFSTREINGFKVTTGAIMVPFGKKSVFQEAFDILNAPFSVRQSAAGFRYRLDHGDFEATAKEGGGLLGTLRFAAQDGALAQKLFDLFKKALSTEEPSDKISFREWLSQYTDNKGVHNLYQGFCAAFVGTSSHEVPAGEFFRFMKAMSMGNRYGIAVNGNIDLMKSLEDGIKQKGSRVDTMTRCREIIIDKGRVSAAVIEHGGAEETVEADYIISNVGPRMTVKLSGKNNFNREYLERLNAHPHETPVYHTCVFSKEPLTDFHGIYNFGNTSRLIFMETPTLTCPELAPGGGHITTTFSVPENSHPPYNTKQIKKEILREIKDNFPVFNDKKDRVRLTFHHGEWPSMRRWPGYPMPVKTPVENLYCVGDGCMPSGTVGIEACAITAKMAAEDIAGKSGR